METRKALFGRRSVRVYSDKAVDVSLLRDIVEAGIHAPYGRNQIWRFALLTEARLINEIAELTRTPAETVKSRLRYALQKLRRLLATEELSA